MSKAQSTSEGELRLMKEVDMVNGGGNVHGGCSAYLIDLSVSKLSDERCLTISQMLYTTDSCAARCD